MIKVKKKNNPLVNQIFAVELADKKHWTLAHLCYLFETEGFYALTFGFFNILEISLAALKTKLEEYDLRNPILVATIDIDPLKKWTFVGEKKVTYENVDVASRITGTWGWFDKTERDVFGLLEVYFGIYPWDLFSGANSIEKILLSNTKVAPNRYLKDFTLEEIKQLKMYDFLEYAERLGELKDHK